MAITLPETVLVQRAADIGVTLTNAKAKELIAQFGGLTAATSQLRNYVQQVQQQQQPSNEIAQAIAPTLPTLPTLTNTTTPANTASTQNTGIVPPAATSDNTIIYVGIGVGALILFGGMYAMSNKKKKSDKK